MKILKRSTAVVLTFCSMISLSLLQAPSAGAEVPLLTFAQANALPDPKPQLWGLEFSEVMGQEINTALYRMGPRLPEHLCEGLSDPKCPISASLYQVISFDVCNPNSKLTCIAAIWAVDSSGKKITGELIRPILFDPKQAVEENVSLNLPKNTSKGTVWRLPGVKNGLGTDNYFVASSTGMMKDANKTSFTYGEISAGIRPVKEVTGDYSPSTLLPTFGSGGGKTKSPSGSECVAVEAGKCQQAAEFPPGFRFGLTIRIGEKLNGWFHGRMSLPQISIVDWQRGQEISIEAEPVTIPNLDFVVPPSTLTDQMKYLFSECEKIGCGGRGAKDGVFQTGGNLAAPSSMELVRVFAPVYRDQATKSQSAWFFKNMFNHGGSINSGLIDKCTPNSGSLTGLVLTNALAYSPGPPSYDATTGSLVYKVASPHLQDDGLVAQGTYDLSIRSEVARCIYGFTNAPIKAEISIAGDEGEKRIATTIVNEKDGWLYLTARGFTFSAPVIRVKLSQDQGKQVENVSKVQVPTKVNSVSITCKKGKISRKVVGINPKCPKGFTKK